MKGFGLGLMLAVLVSLFVPAIGQAAETSASLYDCRVRNPKAAEPPPQPDLPPSVEATLAKAIASEDFEPVCPAGEVPYPRQTTQSPKSLTPVKGQSEAAAARASRVPARARVGRKGKKRGGARISREQNGGYWYSWALGRQSFAPTKKVNGFWASQTNEQPYIEPTENVMGAHSLGQIWAINWKNESCFSTAETGWSESVGQFGDPQPHLFMYAFDCGNGLGYAGSSGLPWVQSSGVAFPNMVVTHNDIFHVYGVRMTGNNWWFYYDGQWVGYIPHSAWSQYFPSVIQEGHAGGEVATPNIWTCTDMGYGGYYGSHPWAALFSNSWYEYNNNAQSSSAKLSSYTNDPNAYSTGSWDWGQPGPGFRYGGPGYC